MRPIATITALLVAATTAALAQTTPPRPPASEDIGSWNLACTMDRMTDKASCILRLKDWVDRPGDSSPGLALEIMDRGGKLVPVITSRDLTLEGAGRGLLALSGQAQLRFAPNPFYEMPCGLDHRTLTCAPRRADADRAERELGAADRVLVRMVGLGSGGGTSNEPVELALTGTRQAMQRFRQFVPPGPPTDDQPGIGGREMMDRLRSLLGR